MTQEMTTQSDSKQVALSENDQAKLMADMGIEARDLKIPRLLLMANTSEAVGENRAKMGDILSTGDDSVIGGIGSPPVELIAIKKFKTHRVMDATTKPMKFKRIDPIVTAEDERKKWEDIDPVDGKPIRRDFTRNFYVLFVKDLAEGNASMPHLISFTRSSSKPGDKIESRLAMLGALGKRPYSESFKIGVDKEKFETNVYPIYTYEKGATQPAAVQVAAQEWIDRLKVLSDAKRITIDEEPAPVAAQRNPVVLDSTPEEAPF